MARSIHIYRLSNVSTGYDAMHLEAVRTAIAQSKELLKHSRPGDTFAGRKTQEPFPKEEEAQGQVS
jgi:hypothetical protein